MTDSRTIVINARLLMGVGEKWGYGIICCWWP